MHAQKTRSGFSLVELLVVIAIIGILVSLVLFGVNAAREAARRTACVNNMRQLGLAILNHESAKRRYPKSDENGYGWLVQILPFAEEKQAWETISERSQRLAIAADDAALVDQSGRHLSEIDVALFRCPSYSGDPLADGANYTGAIQNPSVGNYVALAATHLLSFDTPEVVEITGGPVPTIPKPDNFQSYTVTIAGSAVSGEGNGVINAAGMRAVDILDGMSKTLMGTESREQACGSWYAGLSPWVVGQVCLTSEEAPTPDASGHISTTRNTTLNVGLSGSSEQMYIPVDAFPTIWPNGRAWGPSSEHAGGAINHLFADGHVMAISEAAEPTLYLRFITIRGGEHVSEEAL